MQRAWMITLVWAAGALAQSGPRLLLTPEDFARVKALAQQQSWARSVYDAIVLAAEDWPKTHLQRYGLSVWEVPPEGGQWSQHYICKVHGVSLQFHPPDKHVCPVDGQVYSGWPYDQVIYGRRHSESAAAARDNGLAWQFTRRPEFARAAARILLAYADVYLSYPLKDVNNRPDTSGAARVTAQTLDEAVWLITMAWAYDLISDSDALNQAERRHVEQDLLRPAASLIMRNNRGMSNWQSWHNAAIGAVGFTLRDQALVAAAIDGPSGFRYQMRASVQADGVWYEGAWGYHFYALDPLCQLAEMAARAQIDLWAEPSLRSMFEAPLKFALPDGTLPNFNDSGNVSLYNYDRLYELAYARYADPLFATVLGRRARGREALFWGAPELPAAQPPPLPSFVFEASGNAILRARANDHYVAFKFGPHGGGHGHYDKLNFISFWNGGIMAVDPGTQSYAAPTHSTWDKMTVAHNTLVVDERTQSEATGNLHGFALLPDVSAVRADAGQAYRQAELVRTLLLTPEYLVDLFEARARDGRPHRYDWVYHNYGALSSPLPLELYTAFPKSEGYQHLSNARAAVTGHAWQANFDMNQTASTVYGSVWTSVSGIRASYEYSREQASAGRFSGKLSYDFSAASGYILFSTPALSGLPREAPAQLSVMIYGDGSGHRLALRLYDSTDERFVYTVGPVNWTGWRQITASEPQSWSHYLGNNDGVFDPPVKTVSVELSYTAGGPLRGTLYVDEIALEYAGKGWLQVTGFERPLRNLRLWMLAEPGTTVVLGEGLGPNLLVPVPFVMARRQSVETRFVTLLEPWAETPAINAFELLPDERLRIVSDQFEDKLWFDGHSRLEFVRRVEGALRRLALAGQQQLSDEERVLVELPQPASLQVDYAEDGQRAEIALEGEPEGELRLWGPRLRQISINGSALECRREEDYCVVKLSPAMR